MITPSPSGSTRSSRSPATSARKFVPARRRRTSLSAAVLLLALSVAGTHAAPFHVYLTWADDPSRSIMVNYHTRAEDGAPASEVCYDVVSRGGDPGAYAFRARGARKKIPGLPDARDIHAVELPNLRPDTTYYFVAGDSVTGYSPERLFRTLPDGNEPIRFVTGGDIGVGELANRLMTRAAALDPAFALIGGDLAYANGRLTNAPLWDRFLDAWETRMVGREGRLIPFVAAIGNHETNTNTSPPEVRAPFYYGYFAQGGRSYFSRPIGGNAVLLVLDSDHTAEHGGPQKKWLGEELQRHHRVPFKFACYHVPLYPSYRPYDGSGSKLGREHWGPLFDTHRLTAAFENHDHSFKRSRLLRDGKPDPAGTLYLGDGCFGRDPRKVDPVLRWYLVRQETRAHFWCVDVSPGGVVYQAVDDQGRIFDVALSEPPE